MGPTRVVDILRDQPVGRPVAISGWLRTRRDSGGLSFLEVNDGSCLASLQVIADATLANYDGEIRKLATGAALRIQGQLVASPASGQAVEVQASAVTVLGPADPETYPLQKKRHSFEFLRSITHLRSRTNALGAVARVRSALSFAVHRFFHEQGFLQVHTPVITTSDCEGAGEMFTVTALEPAALQGTEPFGADFFGRRAGLTVSGQLQAEIFALSHGRVYTFGPTFRAENSNTSRHLAEFWMVEPEIAFADLADDATLAEGLLKYVFRAVLDERPDDMAFFEDRIEKGVIAKLQGMIDSDFVRMDYTDAIKILQNAKENFEYPVSWGTDLQSEHERYLAEKHVNGPLVLMNYPKDIKAFYMRLNDDGKTVAAMDVLAPGIGEIIGGSQREERLSVLDARMVEVGLDPSHYSWYRDLRRYGTVPHAGFGLGFERTISYITGLANVRDVIPFPRTPGNAKY